MKGKARCHELRFRAWEIATDLEGDVAHAIQSVSILESQQGVYG